MAEKNYKAQSIGAKLQAMAVPENKAALEKFKKLWEANGTGSVNTLYRYVLYGSELSEHVGKPFKEITEDDIADYINKKKAEGLGQASLDQVKIKVKAFYRWLYGMERGKYPAQVAWMKAQRHDTDHDGDEVLEEEDIQRLIDYAGNARNRAIISLLNDGCLRSIEIRSIRLKDFRINGNHVGRLHIPKSKTKSGIRDIMLIDSVPYLKKWINEHPARHNPNAPIFINWGKKSTIETGKVMGPRNLAQTLERIAISAGVKKRINPHWFRHSGLTMKAQVFNESELRRFAGWDKHSRMAGLYIHESEKIMENKLLKSKGYEVPEEEEKESPLTPVICKNCNESNEPKARFCSKCGAVLDIKTAMAMEQTGDEAAKLVMKDPEQARKALFIMEMLELAEKVGLDKVKAKMEEL